ncbi:MAG: Hpt domain-containing protein [Thiobacillaceae bacterium]
MSTMMEYDTGPLNWVRGEIDKALKAAQERIQAFRSDATLTNALRLAREESHQAGGALRLVGLEGAATVCSAMEEVIFSVEDGSIQPEPGLNAVSSALDGLARWVARMAEGRGEGELALFPFYRALRHLQGVERVFEGELFFPDLQARAASFKPSYEPSPEEFTALVKSARGTFQRGLLAFLKGVGAEEGLGQMRNALSRIESAAPSNSSRTFWWACTGFIDALLAHGVEADFHVKQLLARIDLQMRRLLEGSPQVAERLMRDALFFIAKSESLGSHAEEVKSTFRLDRYVPKTNIGVEKLIQLRPILEGLKEELVSARNAWHDNTGGKADSLAHFQASLNKLSVQAGSLGVPALQNLLKTLQQSASAVPAAIQPETLNLEIATTLLFLQQAVESEDVFNSEFATRSDVQCRRLTAAAGGEAMPDNSVSLMDEGSRQAREHAILTQLGQEISVNLHRMEEILDSFFRNPESRDELPQLDQLAQQVGGALSILDQQSASQLLEAAMDNIRACLDGNTGVAETDQQRIADALSSLGLFVDAHCAGRADALNILTPVRVGFGLMAAPAPAEEPHEATVESGLLDRKSAIAGAYLDWTLDQGEDSKKKLIETLTHLGQDADLIADGQLKAMVEEATVTLHSQGLGQELSARLSQLTGHELPFAEDAVETIAATLDETANESFCPVTFNESFCPVTFTESFCPVTFSGINPDQVRNVEDVVPDLPELPLSDKRAENESVDRNAVATGQADEAGAVPEPAPDEDSSHTEPAAMPEVDPELLEIFLEEAEEVLSNMAEAADACRKKFDDKENLTVIRRGFHTLKGSGRMVGLTDFGEAAWGLEQMMNSWLGADKPANSNLLDVVGDANKQFGHWVNALRENRPAYPDMSNVLARASCLARGEPLDQCEPPVVAEAVAEAAPEPAQAEEIQVGSISLSPGLYQVFTQEAGQRLDALHEEMARLGNDPQSPISEPAARAVHTLAGIAGTAGFNIMADLAHVLELYWGKLEGQAQPLEALAVVHATVDRLDNMVLDIRQMIEPVPALDLIEALARLPITEPSLPAGVAIADEEFEEPAAIQTADEQAVEETEGSLQVEITRAETGYEEPVASVEEEAVTQDIAHEWHEIQPGRMEEAEIENEGANSPAQSEHAEVEPVPVAEAIADLVESVIAQALADKPSTPSPVFEQRVIHDEIDAELLPIFLEEADTLVPDSAASLRTWKGNPADSSAPAALRRTLHTIKGSARMAGANRLGELTHQMETRVLDVLEGRSQANTEVFESLESLFDRLVDTVERLHAGPEAKTSVTVETPVTHAEVMLPQDVAEDMEGVEDDTQAAPVPTAVPGRNTPMLRVRADWVDRMVNQAGEVAIARSRIESEMFGLKRHAVELAEALYRLRTHIREVEIRAESQMQATFQTTGNTEEFDPLEFDRFTRFQEVTRFMAESVNDLSTVQHALLGRLGETEAALTQQARMSRELQQDLLRVRMVPLYSISERLYRVVRLTARDLGKRAQIDIRNGELEMDRSVLEKVTAPLEHLLRNAIAHGLETPGEREASGKPEFGEIQLAARQEGNEMVLVMKDDGAGLNMEKIRAKALANGLLSPGMEPSDAQLAQIIFQAGFSTADKVTEVAGRGVGMDVVKSEISALGGRIEVASETGKGVTFTICLPLTLAVTQAVIISAGKQEYALPATMVGQVQELKPEQLSAALSAGAVEWRGVRYPLFYLPHLLGQNEMVHEIQRYNPVLLMKSGTSYAAFLVDSVLGAREIVVKNIGPQLARITGIAGATVQGDGRIVLILNPVPLALRALQQGVTRYQPQPVLAEVEEDQNQAPLVMVVDDSLTVRKITGRLLTREGYRMETAKDGIDALEKMHDLTPNVVLLDVEMPRMDGFELARVMRSDPILKHVPIIMITSRTAEKHRNRAMEIGVNMYIGKPYQEAMLLDHIAKLLGEKLLQPA